MSVSHRRHRRGFTAAELMVAVTTAMIVCAGAYTLAKSSMDVFQHEARMNAAQYASVMGMNRLVTDVKRAGFMMSPDVNGDLQVCAAPPAPLDKLLVAAHVYEGSDSNTYGTNESITDLPPYPALPVSVTGNNRYPDRLRLAGNYTIAEKFKLGNVDTSTDKLSVEVDQLAVQRIFRDARSGVTGAPEFCGYFPANSVARLVDSAGKVRFIIIDDCVPSNNSANTNYGTITITADDIPTSAGCGEPTGGYISPVSIVDYAPMHLEALTDGTAQGIGSALSQLMADEHGLAAGVAGTESRMVLVRRFLAANGSVLPASAEITADYVVDLNFSGRRATSALQPHVLTPVAFGGFTAVAPNQVRALGIRFSTRARAPDRGVGHETLPTENQPIQRFSVFGPSSTVLRRFARVRTLFTEVAISNLAGVPPW